MWVLFAAISPGIIAFTLYTIVQKKLGASITGFTLYIYLLSIVPYMDVLFFNEQLEYYHYLGTILVFGGVYLVKKKSKNEKKN